MSWRDSLGSHRRHRPGCIATAETALMLPDSVGRKAEISRPLGMSSSSCSGLVVESDDNAAKEGGKQKKERASSSSKL